MSHSTAEFKSYGSEYFLSAENLRRTDEKVVEVFQMMFGLEIVPVETPDDVPRAGDSDERTAVIGFSGALRGSCQIRMSTEAARSVASAMLGGMPVEDDDSVDDALGEVCNMLAGGWKDGIPALSSNCSLSPPTVISGRDYKVHVHKPSWQVSRTYRFETNTLHLILCCEGGETN